MPNNSPNILIIGPTPPPYHGVAVSTRIILDSPAFRRFHVLHLDTSDRRSIENIGAFEAGNILLALRHFFQFVWILARFRPRLVYLPISQGSGGYLRDLLFLLPCRWLGIRTVAHLRGGEFQRYYRNSSALMQGLIRHSLARVRRVIVLGESLRGLFAGLVPEARVVAIPNGSDDFAASQDFKRNSTARVRGLFLSNLRPRKGFWVALEAAIAALQRYPDLEFAFAGDWQSEDVRRQAQARLHGCEVDGRMHFPGVVVGEDKHRLLLESDFFIFPPVEPEGHPRVVLEAMTAGLPVIATPQGAIVETVVDGQTGFLVAPADPAAIVEKIAFWMENPGVMRQMGIAARRRFLECYTAGRANQRLADLFAQVLAE